MMCRIASILVCVVAFVGVGCTKYQFVIIDPPDLATTVTAQTEAEFTTASAEYRLRVVDNRLVIFIYNPGDSAMQLSGSQSVVVGPDGASHPIVGQTIPAGAHTKLILPPNRPEAEPNGPAFGYGYSSFGGGFYRGSGWTRPRYGDRGDRYRYGPYRPRYYAGPYDGPYFYDLPSYTVYDTANPIFWDWRGETQITLTLSFDLSGKVSEDRFVIQRRKCE